MENDTRKFYYKTVDGIEYLVALARIVPSRGMAFPHPRLIVDECPYCGKKHEHSIGTHDGYDVIGVRRSDCSNGGDYMLINENSAEYLTNRLHLK